MAATVSLRVFTGASAATMSAAVTGIDMINADNAINSLANRNAYPVPAGGRSFEKWLKLRVESAPANQISNLRAWTDGTPPADATLYIGKTGTGATPTNAPSSVATADASAYTSTAKFDWDVTHALAAVGDLSDFLVLQLAIDAGAQPGNISTETLSFSYDEQ